MKYHKNTRGDKNKVLYYELKTLFQNFEIVTYFSSSRHTKIQTGITKIKITFIFNSLVYLQINKMEGGGAHWALAQREVALQSMVSKD